MNAKEIARRLEFIKYFTLKKSPIYFNTTANVGKDEEIENKYIQFSNNISFNIESIIVDYGEEYSSSLKSKEIKIYFGKYPAVGPGPNYKYQIINNPDGLMTPAIINDCTKDGNFFKRYIFPSDQDSTYNFDYKTFDEWHQTTLKDVDENYSRSLSMNILVGESSTTNFEDFLNEPLSHWESRFNTAVDTAISGNFDWFNLYAPKIYEYALLFEDRKSILNKLVNSTNWYLTFDLLSDKYELFISLINNINQNDGAALYNYMFEIDLPTGKTNLHGYKDKLPAKLYDELIKVLMKFFYFTYSTKGNGIKELRDGFRDYLLYPIGFLEKPAWEMGHATYFNLKEKKEEGTGLFRLGVKYDIEITNDFTIHIKSAIRYKYNFIPYFNRIEYEQCKFIGDGNTILNYNDVIYVSPFINNQEFNGLDIPYGSVIPIPAFALPWLVNQNENTKNIIDLIEKTAAIAGVVFPIFEIFQGVGLLYNTIGIGFTLVGNTLDSGLKDKITQYDKSKSTPDHPYTKGSDFLETYYLFSAIYGGLSLSRAISTAENKVKVLLEFETLLDIEGAIGDINSFMVEHYPDDLDSLTTIKNEMDQLQIDCKKYQFLKNINY